MSDLNLPKLFNHELNSIYQSKPPVSRAKMASITKQALNAIKYYKHVVIAVEKFIAKCRPEYKLPGLYVIDSIVRQSQYQHGSKDVYGPRFSKNFQTTFENLFQCRDEDKPKIVRVLNLWQKNDIYTPDIIQPLMKLASENRGSFGGESGGSAPFNHSQSTIMESSKKSSQSQSSSTGSTALKGMPDLKDGNSDAALIIQQQQQKIEELMQQQQQLLQAQALQNLLGQNPVLAAAAAAVAVKDKADSSIVTLLQEQQNQLNQLETLKNQLSSQFDAPESEPVVPKPFKESTTLSGHPTEFNKALLDDFDYSDEEEDMTQRIQRQREQVEQQQTRLQDSSSVPDMDMLAQLQEQFRRNEHEHILTGSVSNTDPVSSLPSMMQMPPPPHHQPPPLPHHRHHEPLPSHLPPRRSLSPEPFPPLPPHRRNQPPPPPHFEDEFPPPPQQHHDNMYPMPPLPVHRGGSGFHDNHHSPPPPRFNNDPFYHGDHRFPVRERRRSRSPIPPPGGRSHSPLPPQPRGRSRSPLPPPSGRSRSPLPPARGRSRSPPRGRSRSPHPPGGRSRRWDRDSRGRRSRSPRSRSPPHVSMQHQQQVRGYPHNTWEPTHPELEPLPQPPPPPPPKVEWRGKEIPTPKSKHYSVCSTTIWVGRLPKGITKLQLEEAFKEFGPINSIEMVVQRGCAYVCMVYRADTVRARNGLMNTKIGGSYCKLAWAPGKGVKGPDYKSYWNADDGASFIPWNLVKDEDLKQLAVGGMIDPDTYPPGVKQLSPPKAKKEAITAPLPPKDQDSIVAAPPTQQPPPMAPQIMTGMPPPPIPPPQQPQTFQPPMHMPPPPGAPMNMMPPPAGPFGATPPPPAHMQGPPPPMGGPPPSMRPPFSQPGAPQQFSAPMVSPTFGGGHQIEMQFGTPQINMQHMPPGGGHQMEMLRQPPPATSIPPPQMNSNQFPVAVGNQNIPSDLSSEHQMESQSKEQAKQENESLNKPVESSSAAESDDGDKMDICDTWEQEKVQRLAEEVEKFEQEVMNIERSNLKVGTANNDTAAETSNVTSEAERTVDNPVTEPDKESAEAKKGDTVLPEDGVVERENKQDVTDVEVKSKEETSEIVESNRKTGEGEDTETKRATAEVAANNPTSSAAEQNSSPAEGTNVMEENEQAKMADEHPSSPAKTNEATSFDDVMDVQDSSPEPNKDQPTVDNE